MQQGANGSKHSEIINLCVSAVVKVGGNRKDRFDWVKSGEPENVWKEIRRGLRWSHLMDLWQQARQDGRQALSNEGSLKSPKGNKKNKRKKKKVNLRLMTI